MSFSDAARRAHNLIAVSHQEGDTKTQAIAEILKAMADGLEAETRDIKRTLQTVQDQVRNLR